MKYPKNFGVNIKPRRETDYFLGGSSLDETKINPSGDWSAYLPLKEYQNLGVETMACVIFSALNCLEIVLNFKYKESINFSDRFTAKMSNTTKRGNWMTIVGDSIRNDGLVLESDYPSVWTNWDAYYKPIPQELIHLGTKSKERYKINNEWIIPTNIEYLVNALKIAPIQIVVHAWDKQVNGIYQRTEKALNHAVVLINSVPGQYWEIFDSYDSIVKKLAWDYKIQHGFKYSIIKNKMEFIRIKNYSAVYLLKGNKAYPINDSADYLNLEIDWSAVKEVSKEEFSQYEKMIKKLYTFIR